MSGESLLVILLVGLIAGWLAGLTVRGWGFGLIGNIGVGVIGALIGFWLLPRLGIRIGTGIGAAIAAATVGAIILLIILGLISRRGRWRF
jgi:uncharacterized membrane protein YeaQ/YmgE (transglycosylase-associated protein family)